MEEKENIVLESENNVEEKPSEENLVKEEKKESPSLNNQTKSFDRVPLEGLNEEVPYDQAIEDARAIYCKGYKKSQLIGYIVTGVVLLGGVGAIILMVQNIQICTILGWVLFGIVLAMLIVYNVISRKQLPEITKTYLTEYNKQINRRYFSDSEFTELVSDSKEKLELSDVLADKVYAGVTKIGSRNVVYGKYLGKSIRVCDMGLYSVKGKSYSVSFIGKNISMPNALNFDGRIVIEFKGEKPLDLPNDIEDLKTLFEEGNLSIYGSEGTDYEKVLGKEFIRAIKSIVIEKHLLNVLFVIFAGHSSAYLSYDDAVVSPAHDKPFEPEGNEQAAGNVKKVLGILANID